MTQSTDTRERSQCTNCGFEASDASSWDTVETPQLGELDQCPECGSTRVTFLS